MADRDRNRSYDPRNEGRYLYRDEPPYRDYRSEGSSDWDRPEYEYQRAQARPRDYGTERDYPYERDYERYDRNYARLRAEQDDRDRNFSGPRDPRRFGGGAYAGTRGFGGYEERNYYGFGGREFERDADDRRLPGPFGWYRDRGVNQNLEARESYPHHRDYPQYRRELQEYGRFQERDRPHEGWGEQLRHAGQEIARKVKRAFRGPKGYKRSDERIREDVNDRLAQQDHFDPSEIEVAVSNGEVTLKGIVRSRHEKFLAEEIADDVSGVTEVYNQLRVLREQTAPGAGAPQTIGSSSFTESTRDRNARPQ